MTKYRHYIVFLLSFAVLFLAGCLEANKDNASSKEDKTSKKESGSGLEENKPFSKDTSLPKGKWEAVKRGTIRREASAVGSFYPRQTTKLAAQVTSRVQEILVNVGDAITKGQKLIILDSAFFAIEVNQRKADISVIRARMDSLKQTIKTLETEVTLAKTTLEDADLQLSRMKNLWEKPHGQTPSIPQKTYDDAVFRQKQATVGVQAQESRLAEMKAKILEAAASLDQGEAALRYAEQRLKEAIVYAPYDGVVSARLVDTGELVTSGPIVHIMEVQEIGTLILEFSLPQEKVRYVQVGMPVEFEVEGLPETMSQAPISALYPSLDASTRSIRCRVFVKNEQYKLKPGLLVPVNVILQEVKNALIVPRRALSQIADNKWQAIVLRNDRPVECSITPGLIGDESVEIKEGIEEGEKIFVRE